MRVEVPAKVNLLLRVGPARGGYHELITVFHAVGLYDEVRAEPGNGITLAVSGEGAGELPLDDTNLAWRAAALLAASAGVAPDVDLQLHKRIPIAGGMAGGSADAAATLVACSRLWGVETDLHPLAARLGADVAFLLEGRNALGRGRGEQLTALAHQPELHWVLTVADHGISAGAAYATFDRLQPHQGDLPDDAADDLLRALAEGDPFVIAQELRNDLQPAALALAPALADTLHAGTRAGALAGIVSGSGPTCAFLCRSAGHATEVAGALSPAHRVVVAHGPVPGATVR